MTTKKYAVSTTLMFVALLMTTLFIGGCTQEQHEMAPPPPPTVFIQKPVMESVNHYAVFSGKIAPVNYVEIFPRVEGILEKVHFAEGTIVKKGDVLFTLDKAPYVATLNQAKAELAIRDAELELAKTTYLRRKNAYKDSAVSEVKLMEAKANLASAKASVLAAKAAVTSASLNLSYTIITAPINGRIGRKLVDSGNLVKPTEQTVLTTIVDDEQVYANFTINERSLLKYREALLASGSEKRGGQPVSLGLANETAFPFNGVIDYIGNRIDKQTGTIQVRAIFDNKDHALIAGLYARIKVAISAPTKELLIPEIALGKDQQGSFVMVVEQDNTVRYQSVQTGDIAKGMRIIFSGLTSQDNVIVKGTQKARPGGLVSPVKPDGANPSESTAPLNPAKPAA